MCCGRSTLLATISILVTILVAGNLVWVARRSCEAGLAALTGRLAAANAALTAARAEGDELQRTVAALHDAPPTAGTNTSPSPTPSIWQRVVAPPPPGTVANPSRQSVHGEEVHAHVEPAPKLPAQARALLVIAYSRPEYLARTLGAVLDRLPSYNRPHIYVSQDGEVAAVTDAIGGWKARFAAAHPDVPFTHWRHPAAGVTLRGAASWATGYYKLSQHFGWALDRLFSEVGHPRVIVLEDDLEVSVDFFDYMTATESLLDTDDTLLAVSGWSDIGQPAFASDPAAVLRSDFFPGLGWMLNRWG